MSDQAVVRGNLRLYTEHYLTLELKEQYCSVCHGSFAVSNPTRSDIATISDWNVNNIDQPTLQTLAAYDEDTVFAQLQATSGALENNGVMSWADRRTILTPLAPHFDHLSTEKKTVLAKLHLVDLSQQQTVLSAEEIEKYSLLYHREMKKARAQRWDQMAARMYRDKGRTNGKVFMETIGPMRLGYIEGTDVLVNYLTGEGETVLAEILT